MAGRRPGRDPHSGSGRGPQPTLEQRLELWTDTRVGTNLEIFPAARPHPQQSYVLCRHAQLEAVIKMLNLC